MIIKNVIKFPENKRVNVLIKDGKIQKITKQQLLENNCKVIDGTNLYMSPAFIDVHVHGREPGFEHKETIKSVSNAAIKGGYQTICLMPNTTPPIDTLKIFKQVQAKTQKMPLKIYIYAALTRNLKSTKLVNYQLFNTQNQLAGFTNDGKGIQTPSKVLEIMQKLAKLKQMYVSHAEIESLSKIGVINESAWNQQYNLPMIPSSAEAIAVAQELILAKQTNCKYHVCHVSAKQTVELIKLFKKLGTNVSAEITPHHLLLSEQDIDIENPNFKMNPPLRTIEDQQSLEQAYINQEIHIIATDHAPHTVKEKKQGFMKAPFGIIGLEDAFSLLYTNLVLTNKVSLNYLIETMSIRPAKRFGFECSNLSENSDATFTLIDLAKTRTINANFVSKSSNSPFINKKVKGQIKYTIIKGQIKYKEQK